MFTVSIDGYFAAAHRLREYAGNCERLHGHNWRVRVEVEGEHLNELGMLVDFRLLRSALEEVLSALDHRFLNEEEPFTELNPTTENIARYIHRELAPKLPEEVHLKRVTVWESESSRASYENRPL